MNTSIGKPSRRAFRPRQLPDRVRMGRDRDGGVPDTTVPLTLEITLVNKALGEGEPPPSTDRFPPPGLDRPCKPGHPDLPLSFE
jgi:hypothetical protein